MNAAQITREDVEQAAKDAGLPVLKALTSMQAAAAKVGNESVLDRLCEIKAELIGAA